MTTQHIYFYLLSQAGLRANILAKECNFCRSSVDYLGFCISRKGIAPQEKKVQAILKIQPPTNVRAVWCFLGLLQLYKTCNTNVPPYSLPALTEQTLHLDTGRHAKTHSHPSKQKSHNAHIPQPTTTFRSKYSHVLSTYFGHAATLDPLTRPLHP